MFRSAWFLILVIFPLLIFNFQNCAQQKNKSTLQSSNQVEQPPLTANDFPASIVEKANFTWIDENILQPTCVECHNNSLAFRGYNFTSYEGAAEAVEPGKPEESIMYTRSDSTLFFTLTFEEREIIRAWIALGALNN